MTLNYNPFRDENDNCIPFERITYDDLSILSEIKESYSVEYKSDFSSSVKEVKLPKAISAFANRSGGWFFIGVNDDGTLSDIDLTNIKEETIFSIIESRVTPIPAIKVKIIENPYNINKGVIAIYIFNGVNTPYILNGTVFVRNGKSSDPADRSSMDILYKQSMDYSNIILKDLFSKEGFFTVNQDKLDFLETHPIFNVNVNNYDNFLSRIEFCKPIELYIENNGNHFDENIEMTLMVHKDNYFDIKKLLKGFDKTVEGAFMSLISIPPYHEIVEYKSGEGISSIIRPIEPFQLYSEETNYNEKYMEYLIERECNYYVNKEGDYYYIKIFFKSINPGQKMYLPTTFLACRSIQKIEYSITSKYSKGKINGTLLLDSNWQQMYQS